MQCYVQWCPAVLCLFCMMIVCCISCFVFIVGVIVLFCDECCCDGAFFFYLRRVVFRGYDMLCVVVFVALRLC